MIKVLNISLSKDFTSSKDEAEDEIVIVAVSPTLQPTTDSNSRNPLVIWFIFTLMAVTNIDKVLLA